MHNYIHALWLFLSPTVMIIKLVSYPDWNDSLSLADRKLRIRTAAEILNGNMLANAHLHPEKNSAQRCYHSRRLIAPIYCSDKEELNYLLQAYEI